MAELVNAADCNSCFGSGGSSPLNLKVLGRSIIGNAFDLGSKITGSSPAALIAESHNGSVEVCKS